MFKLEPRAAPSKALTLASPLIALAVTVVIGTILFAALGKDPLAGLRMFFVEPLRSGYALAELSLKATPLILIALG
ncbi:MAG: ABC transporter permease, partial [Aquabacterium sp.]